MGICLLSPVFRTESADSVPPLVFGSSFFLGFTVYISIYGLGCLYLFGRHKKVSSLMPFFFGIDIFQYSVFKVQFRALSAHGLKWTRTTDLTLIRRAL